MYRAIHNSLEIILKKGYTLNPWTNVYGLSRSLIALGLLSTILFTGSDYLFPTFDGKPMKEVLLFSDKISIFYLVKNNFLASFFSVLILLSVIIGVFPQITGILHWWVSHSYMVSGILIEGGDQIAAIITLFLIPITLTDNRKNHWYAPKTCSRKNLKLFVWSVYAIISLQVAIIYLNAAVSKLFVAEWLNGTAIYYWFTHADFGVSATFKTTVAWILSHSWICAALTWGAMLLELTLFGWLFASRNAWNWRLLFLLGFQFHLAIALIHGLVSFSLVMCGALILYLFPKGNPMQFYTCRKT